MIKLIKLFSVCAIFVAVTGCAAVQNPNAVAHQPQIDTGLAIELLRMGQPYSVPAVQHHQFKPSFNCHQWANGSVTCR